MSANASLYGISGPEDRAVNGAAVASSQGTIDS